MVNETSEYVTSQIAARAVDGGDIEHGVRKSELSNRSGVTTTSRLKVI